MTKTNKQATQAIEATTQATTLMHKGVELVAKTDVTSLLTKSAKIRALTAAGHTRMEVSKLLQIKYQHVRNVLITPIKTIA